MIKQFALLLIIFLFFSIIYYFSSKPKLNIEKFEDKTNEKIFKLKDNSFTFDKEKITINADNTFTAPLNKVEVSKLSNLKYSYSISNLKCFIDIIYNDNPIKINVNDYSYIIQFKKSNKFKGTLNIFINDDICGCIKNNELKTDSPDIYDDVAIVGVIFLSYLLYRKVEDFESKDYDSYFSSKES